MVHTHKHTYTQTLTCGASKVLVGWCWSYESDVAFGTDRGRCISPFKYRSCLRAPECGTAAPYVSMDENNVRGGLEALRFVCSTPSNPKINIHRLEERKVSAGGQKGAIDLSKTYASSHKHESTNT